MSLPLFDAHLHIIDPNYPLIANQGYLPNEYTTEQYLQDMSEYDLQGGVVVSGSFQGYDQSYLVAALDKLNEADANQSFVGITQLPADTPDDEILKLNDAGVKGIRFNLKRGGSESAEYLEVFGKRVHELCGWHTELYIDAKHLVDLTPVLQTLPSVSIDHLGLSQEGLPHLLKLVEAGVHVKATGFSRGDLDIPSTLKSIHKINPNALMFGTDLPGTRAPKPFCDADYNLVIETLGIAAATRVFCSNALSFYRIESE